MATFVIVHGAWGGAWSWNKYVVPLLRQAGHTVHPATLSDGDSAANRWPGRLDEIQEQARREGDGWKVPPGDAPPDQPAEIIEWARPRRTPMPIKTMTTPVRLTRGETTLPRAFVYCSVGKTPGSPQVARAERVKNNPAWRNFELNTGHNLHYTAPEETVKIL